MKRPRLLPILLILLGISALLYVVCGLYLPSARKITLGVDKQNGRIRVVKQSITFLPWHKFYLLSFEKRQGAAQTNGLIRITSREGVPVKLTYRLRFGFNSDRLPDSRRLVNDGWGEWLRTRVAEAVSAVTTKVPIEEFATPTSQFSRQRNLMRDTVARHLARSGLTVTAFEIEQIDIDRDALLRYKRAELRRNARGTFSRVAVFAIDGADWELLSELMTDERLPNIKALVQGGASGSIATIQPTVSPMLWTTMATGVSPDRHGVIDFFDHQQNDQPVDSRTRRVPAVWEVAEAFNRNVVVSNWWTAWPASYSGVYTDAPVQLLSNAAAPEQIAKQTASTVITDETVGPPQLSRFMNLAGSEYETQLRDPNDPASLFRSVLAKTWSDHRRAMAAYRLSNPTVLMMNYEGTDFVNHLFGPYHPPYREDVSEVGYRKYWRTVTEYYAEIDRLLGEWLKVLPPDTTVMIVSAHGMRWGKDRPKQPPQGLTALANHRGSGVFIAFGQQVAPNRARRPLSIYDVAPTILSLIGLPKSAEMPGQPAVPIFKNLQVVSGINVGSYQDLVIRKPQSAQAEVDPKIYRARLQQIGHLVDPNRAMMVAEDDEEGAEARPKLAPIAPQQWGLYAYYNNAAIDLKKQKKFREALESAEKAMELNPARPTPYLNYARLLMERQQFTSAESVFFKAVSLGLPNAEQQIVDFAALYRDRDMPSRAINVLVRGKQLFPQSYLISANLGSALAASKRYTDATAELERALAIQPSSTLALNNLGLMYVKREDYGRALDYWNRSLTVDPRQPQIRDAANAVRTRL